VTLTNKSTTAIMLLCLHLLVDEIEGMYMTRKITQAGKRVRKRGNGWRRHRRRHIHREQDVDQKITTTACNKGSGCRREKYGNLGESILLFFSRAILIRKCS
jgi:hypothetical protein